MVPESQADLYRKRYGDAVDAIPDELDGSIPRKRNAVLDLIQEREQDSYGFMIDDDVFNLKRKKENIRLSGDEALEILERLYIMAKDMGATFGGFDYSEDCMKLKDMAPFSLGKPIYALVLVKADDGVRYDTRFRVCEDVDFWAAKIHSSRRLIKDNQYAALAYGDDGGSDSVIGYNVKTKQHYATLINKKWGQPIMKWNKSSFRFKLPVTAI